MLVGRAHDAELLSEAQTILDGSFPLARTHVMVVVYIAHIPLCKSVTREHLHERSLVAFAEAFPVVSSISGLVTHVMRGHEDFLSLEGLLPVLDGSTSHQRRVQVMVKSHMVAMLHAVGFISDERKEFAFLVVFLGHRLIFLISSGTKSPECISMIIYHPAKTRIVLARNIRPHCMRSHTHEVELSFGSLECITHVAMSVCEVAVIVKVSPEHLQIAWRRHHLLRFLAAGSA